MPDVFCWCEQLLSAVHADTCEIQKSHSKHALRVDSISHEAAIKQTSQLTWNFHSLFSACEIFNLSHTCLMLSADGTEPAVCLGMCQISSTEQKAQQ